MTRRLKCIALTVLMMTVLSSVWADERPTRENPASDFDPAHARWIGAISRADSGLPVGDRSQHVPSPQEKAGREQWEKVPDIAKRSILLRKSVRTVKAVERAVLSVVGLGHYELYIDGVNQCGLPSGAVFQPHWSDYDKTVYYNRYDISETFRGTPGEHVFGVCLGNGFYNVSGNRYLKLKVTFGPPTLLFQLNLTYTDGTTETYCSDESWKWHESPITFNCIFGGEDYDARLEQPGWCKAGFDDSRWKPVVVQEPPLGRLTRQTAPPVQIMQTYPAKSVKDVGNDTKVFDMGQNLSGFPTVTVQGRPGQTIRLVPGESLNADGTVNQKRTGSPHYYEYTIGSDRPETWRPSFSYYGYQYIQVQGADYLTGDGNHPVILDLVSNFVYNSAEEVGTFECSN
ncbi:family 78 glycoside hydrolase catalytic domain, partial [Alistipes sp. OttesenSCG-928-L06]|nr:family 78 glycoside hydrolase catalytic domain [Alistipes sp. OttesenSCG-928-L06]